ncbi:cysteine desulfurase family protein [Flavobacterium subsaxonicum]|uniref:cysteine desulfurase n=1 Tax=Flavobacterium subsaxonicum WB 4.1-42 = DSM 21790 TaxID=1121898 RepID=A0A0A2MHP2_9FLAO|nr:cysteine desulfurase family protein [Flavobacterium subsaxonicum]KGO91111.1 cysteine desulfurase [Flavobacterium subsaxonicum WB 4.1-42 = DSM 21790]
MPERNKIIYLDNNATTRLDNRVLEAMLPYFTTDYANASSSHLFGLTVNEAVEAAREQVAALIGARPKEITFTSGATEAINLAIKGLVSSTKKHIVTVVTEHKAILDTCAYMEQNGFEVTYLPVNQYDLVNLEDLEAAIRHDTLLVCVMLANNETGVIQPVSQISSLAHAKGALFMTDATQAVGKLPIDVQALGIDLMPLSAHKFYGPKGVGALYVSSTTRQLIEAQQHGGGHERKLRSGTLNVPGIVGLGKACEIAEDEMDNDTNRIEQLRNHLENELLKITDTYGNGSKEHRLYNTTNLCFKDISSEKLILSLQNIAVSNGSACSAVTTEPSYVLKALGLTDADALASIRFSLGRFTTIDDIETTITKVTELVATQRQTAG